MNKLFAVAVLAIALLGFAAPAAYSDVPQAQIIRIQDDQTPAAPQPSAADVAAYDAFQQWAADHKMDGVGRYHASEDGKTVTSFDLALVIVDADGNAEQYKWIVYGYPTVAEAAAQIESDYTKYPDGHQTEYVAPDSSEKKA